MKGISTKLVLFTIFTVIVTFWLSSVIGNISLFSGTYELKARFTDATGVLKGDLVKIAGVNVGKVTNFEVDGSEAVVTMEINDQYEIPKDVFVEIKFRNLLGQRMIVMDRPEPPSEELLGDGDEIPAAQTSPALDLSVVFNNLRPLIQSTNPEHINIVARAVLEVFEGREGEIAGILQNLGDLADTLNGRGGRLTRLIEDLDDLARVLNRESGSIRTGIGRFAELMESLAAITPTIERVVIQLDDASSKFGRLLARNRSNLDQELRDLASILRIVNDNLGPLDKVAKNLKEVLLATARSQSYGEWWNLYVVNLCPETGAIFPQFPDPPDDLSELTCDR